MKKSLFLAFLLITFQSFSQNEASTCFFGNMGLDFRTLPPQPIYPIPMVSWESPASICDSLGNILFYTNGGNSPLAPGITGAVWNANHSIMENGILGDSSGCVSSYQGAIILPFPSDNLKTNSNLYYLFTKDCVESSFSSPSFNSGLTYAVIDMNQNAGLGKVIQKNVTVVPYSVASVHSTDYEPVSAILHGNDTDYWLFSYTNDSLYRLQVSSLGIENFKMLVPGSNRISISPNRDYLCSGRDIYELDAFTGDISYLGSVSGGNSKLTFSPDGSKLYHVEGSIIYQYNLSQGNFLNTKTPVGNASGISGLFLAPDHKIYIYQTHASSFTAQIRCPNSPGSLCDFSSETTYLGGGYTETELTNLMAHYLYYDGSCTAGLSDLTNSGSDKKLIKILDQMGRETEEKANTFLIYMYSDGSTEKVFRVE